MITRDEAERTAEKWVRDSAASGASLTARRYTSSTSDTWCGRNWN